MARKLKPRRGTTAQNNAFTGEQGEITLDTTKNTIIVHDGSTLGGHPLPTTNDLSNELALKVNYSAIGAPDGVAPLGPDSKVPAANLPSYVDDVLEYADFASLPVTGETGKIYITLDTNNCYRWSGSVYVKIADDDVLLYADLAAFPANGAAGAIYIAQDTGKLYRWVSTGVYAELAPSPDEVQQYANFAAFPATGEAATLYIAADTGLVYRWDGSAYAATGLQPIADQTLLGNISGGVAVPAALTKTQVQTLLRNSAVSYSPMDNDTYVLPAGTSSLYLEGSARTNVTVDCSSLALGDPPLFISAGANFTGLKVTATGYGALSANYRVNLLAHQQLLVLKSSSTNLYVAFLPSTWLEEVRDNTGIHNPRGIRAIRVPNENAQGANVDFSIVPRGNGAFALAVADGAVAGGNKRGAYAVDLQLARNAATQIASGNYSILLSGERCTASASHTGAGGYTCAVSGQYSFAYGSNLSVAGTNSQAFGGNSTINASAYAATALGFGGVLGGGYTVGCGDNYRDRDMSGLLLLAANNGSSESGMRQNHLRVLKRTTTDATTAYLSWTGSDGTTSQYVLDAGRIAVKRVRVVAVNEARTAHAVWEGTVIVQRKTTAATTTVLLDTIAQISSSGTGNTWVVAAAADTTNGLLSINITGEAATTIRWTADVDTLESM